MSDPIVGFRHDYGMIQKDSISLLDQFAMAALSTTGDFHAGDDPKAAAWYAYLVADAMMAEREKRK